jgi:hypothetical protein
MQGKRFRARFAEALWRANAPDVVAECTEGIWGHPKYALPVLRVRSWGGYGRKGD